MTEETAVRIAEVLERINGDLRSMIVLMVGFAIAFYIIALFKN